MKRPGIAPPQWGYEAPDGAIVVPAAGKAAVGYAAGERPPAGWWNYHLNLTGQWLGYLAGPSLTVWSAHSFPAPDTAYVAPIRAAVDGYTADETEARYRYVVATHDATGPCVLVSRRGQSWALRRNLPVGAGSPLGVASTWDLWILWTDTAIYVAERDDPSYPSSGAGASALRDSGTEWTAATLPASPGAISCVAYGGNAGGGSAVASTSTKLLTSNTTGATWSVAASVPVGRQAGRDVAGAGETYVDISSDAGDGYILRSQGGDTWTNVQTLTGTGADTSWRVVAGATTGDVTTFVAFKTGVADPHLHVSTDDGVTWAPVSASANLSTLTSLAWNDGVWIATSTLPPYALTSSDLEHWVSVSVPVPDAAADAALYDALCAQGSWLLVSRAGVLRGAPAVEPGPEGYVPGTTASPLSDAGWLRGRRIHTTAPNNGDVYSWNAATSRWEPVAASSLSVTTTRGDLIRRGASADERLALGTRGHVLRAGATDAGWSEAARHASGALPTASADYAGTIHHDDDTKSYYVCTEDAADGWDWRLVDIRKGAVVTDTTSGSAAPYTMSSLAIGTNRVVCVDVELLGTRDDVSAGRVLKGSASFRRDGTTTVTELEALSLLLGDPALLVINTASGAVEFELTPPDVAAWEWKLTVRVSEITT